MSKQFENKYELNGLGYFETERIYIKELKFELDYSTNSSIKSWCKRHKITLLGDGQKKFIYRYDLNRVNISFQMRDMKQRYGEKWEYAFELAQSNELYKLEELAEPQSVHNIQRYKPQSSAAKKIFER